jgi:DNA-directed RNA polymerase specialized sigma24 family protein
VASASREILLRAHSFRLRREDLEDCYSQATLEMLRRVRRGASFADRKHIRNALEQRFVSRIHDRRRALAGRSPMLAALESAARLGPAGERGLDVVDRGIELEQLVLLRLELRRIPALAQRLSADQQLVLASQVGLQQSPAAFCKRFGWSAEKYRKVAQRARARLHALASAEDRDVPHPSRASEESAGTSL